VVLLWTRIVDDPRTNGKGVTTKPYIDEGKKSVIGEGAQFYLDIISTTILVFWLQVFQACKMMSTTANNSVTVENLTKAIRIRFLIDFNGPIPIQWKGNPLLTFKGQVILFACHRRLFPIRTKFVCARLCTE